MQKIVDFLVYLMLILASGAVIQLLQEGGARDQGFDNLVVYDGWLNLLPVLWQVVAVLFIGLMFIRSKWRDFHFNGVWAALITLSLLSLLWSAFPKHSFHTSVAIFLSYFIVSAQVEMQGWKGAIQVLHKFFMAILVLSIAAVFILPSYGVSVGEHAGKWQGVFTHKNALGNFASLSAMFYMWKLSVARTKLDFYGIGLSVTLILGSGSSTALANLFIFSTLFVLFQFSIYRKIIFNFRYVIFTALVLIVAYFMAMSISGETVALMDKDTSFTGRNLIWGYFLQRIEDAPWFGHGLGQFGAIAAGDDQDLLSSVGFVMGSAHNGFIESLYALGIVGGTLVLIVLVRLLSLKNEGGAFKLAFVFVFFIVVLNMFESELVGFNLYFIFLMYVVGITRSMTLELLNVPSRKVVSRIKVHRSGRLSAGTPKKGRAS